MNRSIFKGKWPVDERDVVAIPERVYLVRSEKTRWEVIRQFGGRVKVNTSQNNHAIIWIAKVSKLSTERLSVGILIYKEQ